MKRSPIKRRKPLNKVSKLKHRREARFIPKDVREAVQERSQGRCEGVSEFFAGYKIHTGRCLNQGEHLHHVIPKGRGGKNEVSNLLNFCAPCHRFVHDNPKRATQLGLLK